MSVDLMLPAAEKITPVLEGIGDVSVSHKRDEAPDKHLDDALIVSPMRALLSGSGSSAMPR